MNTLDLSAYLLSSTQFLFQELLATSILIQEFPLIPPQAVFFASLVSFTDLSGTNEGKACVF